MPDNERRFSLDPIKAGPSLRNLIYSADGDETVGEWNGEDIHDLVRELDRIEGRVDANYNSCKVENKNLFRIFFQQNN